VYNDGKKCINERKCAVHVHAEFVKAHNQDQSEHHVALQRAWEPRASAATSSDLSASDSFTINVAATSNASSSRSDFRVR
jgi:hypothetical protein